MPAHAPGCRRLGEPRVQEQIFGWIAGEHQFGEGYQVRLGGPRFFNALQDDFGVACDVSNSGVDLGQRQAKAAHELVLQF